jgi:predicted PurR-regulated permease PerM
MEKKNFMSWTLESSIRIALLFLLIVVSFLIFRPFLIVTVWGIILAVAFYPIFLWLKKTLKGKSGLSAGIISAILLIIVILVSFFVVDKLINNITFLSEGIKSGSLKIAHPPEKVKEWPIIGSSLYDFWHMASTNIESAIAKAGPRLKGIAEWLLLSVKDLISSIFISIFAIIIAGLLLNNAEKAYSFSIRTFDKILGKRAKLLVDNSRDTIQSVVKGVMGVAIIQALLVGIGLWFVGVPGAALLTLIVFVLALIQIPPIILVLPIIIYVFSKESTTVAVIFAIYEVIAGASDNFLKPMLLGRGLKIPMLIILIGALGGVVLMGMIGLFIGPVIFALAYEIFNDWIQKEESI